MTIPELTARVEILMLKAYPPKRPPFEGAIATDYNFEPADVMELERKMRRGEL